MYPWDNKSTYICHRYGSDIRMVLYLKSLIIHYTTKVVFTSFIFIMYRMARNTKVVSLNPASVKFFDFMFSSITNISMRSKVQSLRFVYLYAVTIIIKKTTTNFAYYLLSLQVAFK